MKINIIGDKRIEFVEKNCAEQEITPTAFINNLLFKAMNTLNDPPSLPIASGNLAPVPATPTPTPPPPQIVYVQSNAGRPRKIDEQEGAEYVLTPSLLKDLKKCDAVKVDKVLGKYITASFNRDLVTGKIRDNSYYAFEYPLCDVCEFDNLAPLVQEIIRRKLPLYFETSRPVVAPDVIELEPITDLDSLTRR